jgi:hypothetical protein
MISLDHHIVPTRDRDGSARWLSEILGLPAPSLDGPFASVALSGDTKLYFAPWEQQVVGQHYAFAVGDDDFDRIVDRLDGAGIEHWADHTASEPGTVRRDSTGNGVYFFHPDGHLLEVLSHRTTGRAAG